MKDKTFMTIARTIAQESKCVSMQVGAVVVLDDRIIATGYNGTPSGQPNCCDLHSVIKRPDMWQLPFRGWSDKCDGKPKLTSEGREEHHAFSNEHEIHAELNAILFAAKHGISIDGATMYVTLTPCKSCAKALTQSGIKRIVYDTFYDKNEPDWDSILVKSGVIVEQLGD